MVGHLPLEEAILVRVQVPQLDKDKKSPVQIGDFLLTCNHVGKNNS